MRVGFDLYLDETPVFIKLAEYLRDNCDAESSGATLGKRYASELSEYPEVALSNMSDYFRGVWDKLPDLDKALADLEIKYEIDNLSQFIMADRFLVNKPYDYSRRYLLASFLFWEDYFERFKPEIFVGPGISFLPDLVSFVVSQKYNCNFLALFGARYPHFRFAVSVNNISEQWNYINDNFAELKSRELAEQERAEAMEFLSSFRQRGTGPDFYKISPRHQPKLSLWHLNVFRKRFVNYYFKGQGRDPYDFITRNPLWYAYRDLKRILLAPVHARMFFEKPREGEKYVLYPLHFQPEANTLVMAPYMVNQIAVVENIAKSLPVNYYLYVKEHFSSIGHRKADYYRELRKIPNVRLIDPFYDSHKLVRNSGLIITISSTMGWEALLYDKPTVLLGNAFYGASELCYKVDKYPDLPSSIRRALTSHKPDREKLLRFILALLRGTYPGRPALPHVDPKSMLPENIKLFSEGIRAEYERIKRVGGPDYH